MAGADETMSLATVRVGGIELIVLSFPLPGSDELERLTSAEREVAMLAMQGRTSAEIAEVRATSVRTVSNQLAAIFKKLGVSSRTELAASLVPR